MITEEGYRAIGGSLAELLGGSIAVGVGSTVASAEDVKLNFEVFRTPVLNVSFDNTGTLVAKGRLPENLELTVYEVGLFSVTGSEVGSTIIASFEDGEDWDGGSTVTTDHRIGERGMRVNNTSARIDALNIDLSDFQPTDEIEIARYGTGAVIVDLMSTDEDYYTATFPSGSGYSVSTLRIADLVATGDAGYGITSLRITTTTNIQMDAIRLNKVSSDSGILVARSTITPIQKSAGRTMDIEIPIYLQPGGTP